MLGSLVRRYHLSANAIPDAHLAALAAASAASWYAAHPTYTADSEAETLAALDETA